MKTRWFTVFALLLVSLALLAPPVSGERRPTIIQPQPMLLVPNQPLTITAQGTTALTAGGYHTCALTSEGGVKCWGQNYAGQLGDATTMDRTTPVDVIGLNNGVIALVAGAWHTCALTSGGGVKCWGNNGDGQLGNGMTESSTTPVDVIGLNSGVIALAAGDGHTCALTSGGGVKCWGHGYYGQLGNGSMGMSTLPVDVSGLSSGITALTAGGLHTCALSNAGGIKCWGYNYYGQLGDGTTTMRTTPANVSGLSSGMTVLTAGGSHTCAVTSGGGVKCWGLNSYGQLGDGTTTRRLTPVNVSGLSSGVTALAAGSSHTCTLTNGGGVKCWGNNYYGQLGDGTTTNRLTPVNVSGLSSGVTALDTGGSHTCTLTNGGGVKCWGLNSYGQLGNSTTTNSTTPVDVVGLGGSNPPLPSDKPPIVFVHGWAGWPPFPLLGPCDWPDPDRYFESVDDYLRAAGYHIEYAHLETSHCYTPPLTENIWRLQNAIALAKSVTHQTKVILVAHSMGGLVSRAYIENDAIYENDVEVLFTFGSPHLGVPSDLVTFFLNGATLGVFCKDRQPAVCDFSEIGMRLFNKSHGPRSYEVDYHLISGNSPHFSRNGFGKATDMLIPGPDDGITPTNSGLGGDNPSFFLDRLQTDENHNLFGIEDQDNPGYATFNSYFYKRKSGDVITETSLSYVKCLKQVLVDKTSDACGSGAAQTTTQETSAPTARTAFEYGVLQPGQTTTRNISVEGGITLFATQWQTGTLTVTLVDPNGQIIDPTYAASHPDVVTYDVDANIATYYFPNATTGQWQLKLQANSDVPSAGSGYTTFTAFESTISLTGQTDRDWYAPGATATIAASLSGSLTSATVTATVLDANGTTQSVSLSPVGGGNYHGTYTVSNVPGYAEVRLVATGVAASGVSFERGKNLVFQISPNSISLNGAYSDAPQPRASNPSLYEALNVTVGINAAVSGRFGLSADLMDASGNFVVHSLTIENINPGPGILTLRFEGDDIYASRRNGPYTLTNLLLTDQRNATLAVAEVTNVYTTAAYDYRNFASASIYLPIIIK